MEPPSPNSDAALRLLDVDKTYPGASAFERALTLGRSRYPAQRALNGVSIALPYGEILGVLGPNGSGKSTLMRCAAGLLTPSGGRVEALGGDPARSAAIRGQIGLVVRDDRAFNQRLSGRENLRVFGLLQRLPPDELGDRVQSALALANLTEKADTPYRAYSSGMKQRLSLARALLGRPRLLLMDEATSGLDPGLKGAFYRLVKRLADEHGVAILYATHEIAEAADLCHRAILLERGRVAASGPWAEIADTAARVFELSAVQSQSAATEAR